MLEIHYTQHGGPEKVATYAKSTDFLAVEFLEVPPFDDRDIVTKAELDGAQIDLADSTIGGLFAHFNGTA